MPQVATASKLSNTQDIQPKKSSIIHELCQYLGSDNISCLHSAQTNLTAENKLRDSYSQPHSSLSSPANNTPHSPSNVSYLAKERNKERFNRRFPHLNIPFYTDLTQRLLSKLYPKYCPHCKNLLTKGVKGRESSVRCPECHYIGSRTAYTPLHHLKVPLWVFSYLLTESLELYPQVMSGQAIKRRLGVAKNTALLLKRRLQLLYTHLLPAIKNLITESTKDLIELPEDQNTDLSSIIKGKSVIHCDTVALFSASQRSNGGRSRHKHSGQTASIYLTDVVAEEKGKYQIGTLCHTTALANGAVLFDSIPDQRQVTIMPLLDFIPKNRVIFTDQGYPWLKRYYDNARSVNHNAHAKNKKNRWAKDRWCKNGISNQVAEGVHRIVKHSFISGYGYVSPRYSQLYLNEYAALKTIRSCGLASLLDSARRTCAVCDQEILYYFFECIFG